MPATPATLSKTKKIGENCPPREIRDDTKARRAWVAQRIAELTGTTGPNGGTISAKSIGIGSYQCVAIYETTQGEGRIQLRGVCQACGSSVAIEDGRTSLHGYKRPGTGYTEGRCPGAQEKPANVALELTHSIIDSLTKGAAEFDATAAKLHAKAKKNGYPSSDLWTIDREAAIAHHSKTATFEKEARNATYRAECNRQYVTHLEATAVPALGTAFAEIVVA